MDGLDEMDDLDPVPFPTYLTRDIKYKFSIGLDNIRMQNNIAAAIYELLQGPNVEVYYSYQDWSLPISKYETAMFLLKPEHLNYLRSRILDIQIDDQSFYLLFFLLCAAPGRFTFGSIFNPERFLNKPVTEIYTKLTGNQAPVNEYEFTQNTMNKLYQAFLGGYYMYYFFMYSRRVLDPAHYISILDQFDNKNMLDLHFYQNHVFARPSITHNDLSILILEYYQNYSPTGEGNLSVHSKEIVKEFELLRPQHKTRRQLLKVYNYIKSVYPSVSMVPRIGQLIEDKRFIFFTNEQGQDTEVKEISTYPEGLFPFLVSSLASKLKTETEYEGVLTKLAISYANYQYSIEYLYKLLDLEPDKLHEYLAGLAAYHLLYQCLSGRTSKYVDLAKQNVSMKPGINKLKHMLKFYMSVCPLLRTIPSYADSFFIQEAQPLDDVIKEFKHHTDVGFNEIDNTISMICSVLEVSTEQYANIINDIIERLELREHFGVIKTSFQRHIGIDSKSARNMYNIIMTIADYQGRNALVLQDLDYADYDQLNSQLRFLPIE